MSSPEFKYYKDNHFGYDVLESPHSWIEYYFDTVRQEWVIEDLSSKERGWGKKTIKEFVERIGPDKRIFAAIIEIETKRKLVELGYLKQLKLEYISLDITSPEILNQLKIVKVFQGGGVHVDVLNMSKVSPKEKISFNFIVSLMGRT